MAEEKNEYDQFADHRYLTTADIPGLLELAKKNNKPASPKKAPAKKAGGKKS